MNVDSVVDARGQSCPMPVVLARKGINALASGQVMVLEATDPGSCKDIPSWVRDMGHELVETAQEDSVFRYVIRKG